MILKNRSNIDHLKNLTNELKSKLAVNEQKLNAILKKAFSELPKFLGKLLRTHLNFLGVL